MGSSMIHNGRELVLQAEFARRVGIPKVTIGQYIKKGYLHTVSVPGSSKEWLDWETQRIQLATVNRMPQKTTRRNKEKQGDSPLKDKALGDAIRKMDQSRNSPDAMIKQNNDISIKGVGAPSVPSIKDISTPLIGDQMPRSGDIIDTDKIDPDDYPECWIYIDNEVLRNKTTNKPELDLQRLKDYLTNVKYQMDIKKTRALLIEKSDVLFVIQNTMLLLTRELASIPKKFAEPIFAFIETKTGEKLSREDKSSLIEMLERKPEEILQTVKKSFEELSVNANV